MTASASFAAETTAPTAAPLTLGEQFIVRAYAGQLEGMAITNVIKAKTLGIAVNNSTICVALAGAMAGEFVGHNKAEGLDAGKKGETPVRRLDIVAYTPDTDPAVAVKSFKDKDAVALLFGGQVTDENNAAAVRLTLAELAKDNYTGAIFLHLTVAAKKWVDQAAAADSTIADYLAKKDNVYALAVDVEKKQGHVKQMTYKDGKSEAKSVFETPLNDGFLALFKRRLIPAQ
ncbi:MAG: hypothetical protein FNT29_07855 [Halothiobacillaceae bacterium]|nr:MAG: hypothetical protein FNT29_07855 [Halothiobacillaceae bacterium]